jgi:hypothetical protein
MGDRGIGLRDVERASAPPRRVARFSTMTTRYVRGRPTADRRPSRSTPTPAPLAPSVRFAAGLGIASLLAVAFFVFMFIAAMVVVAVAVLK